MRRAKRPVSIRIITVQTKEQNITHNYYTLSPEGAVLRNVY